MEKHSNIVSAIQSFTRWERPWEFFPSISASPILSTAERAELEKIWEVAAGQDTWVSVFSSAERAELEEIRGVAAGQDPWADSIAYATARLSASYPWLPASALHQLINGAAYQWR